MSISETIQKDSQFNICFPFILEREGGYVNDPKDPGGETKYGISKRAFPQLDIKNLTVDQAKIIYYQHYWLPYSSTLEWPLNLCVFDCAVNQGGGKARKYLEDMRQSKKDWRYFLELRAVEYTRLRDKTLWAKRFYKGWMNRLNELKKYIEEKDT